MLRRRELGPVLLAFTAVYVCAQAEGVAPGHGPGGGGGTGNAGTGGVTAGGAAGAAGASAGGGGTAGVGANAGTSGSGGTGSGGTAGSPGSGGGAGSASGGASGAGGNGGASGNVDNCPGLDLLPTGSPPSVSVTQSNVTLSADQNGTCNGTDGRDAVYHVVAPQSGTVKVTLTPQGNVNVVLIVRTTACSAGVQLVCKDSAGTGNPETVSSPVVQGQEFWIIADTYKSTGDGSFQLTISYV